MREQLLLFSPPLIGEEEINEVCDTLRSGWITTGPKTKSFGENFREYVGAPDALPLNSCTSGLHLALVTLGIGPNDEVITTPLTFAASVNVIEHVGAKPVLVDVEPDTLNISPDNVAAAITPRTKAILPVHYAGHPVDLDCINDIAHSHKLAVVEDAAHAIAAQYKGKYIGAGSNLTSFSFYATKNLTTGEGGMLTGDPEFIEKARLLSLHGMSRDAWKRYGKGGSWYYEVVVPGFKCNMTDIQAAIGLWQLKKLDDFQARRQQVVQLYNDAFGNEEVLEIPLARPEVEHAWHLYVLRLHLDALQIERNQFIEELMTLNIGTSVHFIPIHIHPYYAQKYDFKPNDFPVTFSNYERMISLPLNPCLSDQDVTDVIEAVLDIVRRFKR